MSEVSGRVTELRAAYQSNVEQGRPPYAGVTFRGIEEVMWVINERGWSPLPDSTDEVINLSQTTLKGSDLTPLGTHSRVGGIAQINLEGANLEGADLSGVTLGIPKFDDFTWLSGADGRAVNLRNANLNLANLSGTTIGNATLQGATLHFARLTGASLFEVDLSGARISGARMDPMTMLRDIIIDPLTRFGDVIWNGASLTRVDWGQIQDLGDSLEAWKSRDEQGKKKSNADRLANLRDAEVANRNLASTLRSQGLSMYGDHFAYRAQVLHRQLLRHQGHPLISFSSWLLDLISGYGYRPLRSFLSYIVVILVFAAAFFALGGTNDQPLPWNEALVVSMTAFHGRGFFSSAFQPGDIQAAVAAIEAFIGLLIEIVLIATFTQRFFAR